MASPVCRASSHRSRHLCLLLKQFCRVLGACRISFGCSGSWCCGSRCCISTSSTSNCCRNVEVWHFGSSGGASASLCGSEAFAAERFHTAGSLQWLECLESLAATSRPSPAAAAATKATTAATEGDVSRSCSGGLVHYGGFGWGPGALSPEWLLWRLEDRLQRLPAAQLVRVAAALQRLGMRDVPSAVYTQESSKDAALLLLLKLNRHLRRRPRCLSLHEVAAAARALSAWRFAGEDAAAAQQQQQQQGAFSTDPLKLRASTFKCLLVSATAQLSCLRKQQQQQQLRKSVSSVLLLLQACAKLQLTELRKNYLQLLLLLQQHVKETRSLLQLALLLYCCTRLLVPDVAVYRHTLQRLADWRAFQLLLQQERHPAAAQVALGQLALSCIAFKPSHMDALEAQQQQQQDCGSHNSRLSELQEAVLLNVLRAAAIFLQRPALCGVSAAGTAAAAAEIAAAEIAAAAKAATGDNKKRLGFPSAFLLRQLQIAALALRQEHPKLLSALAASSKKTKETKETEKIKETEETEDKNETEETQETAARSFQQIKELLVLLEALSAEAVGSPRKGRSSSEQHASVAAALHALGVHAEKEARAGPYEADLLLPEMRFVLEVDGPLHFLSPPRSSKRRSKLAEAAAAAADPLPTNHSSSSSCVAKGSEESCGLWGGLWRGEPLLVYDVKSALKHRLLEALGWKVLHIAWHDWPRDRHNQHRALAHILRQHNQQQEQQQQQATDVGLAWGGCGGSLLLYKPQFGGLLQGERQAAQQQNEMEMEACCCDVS